VSRTRHDHEPVLLTQRGKAVAAIVSLEDLEEFQRVQDAADLAECEAITARSSAPGIPHDDFMALLDAEDAAQA
jgi:prevent-host-death family protein